MYTVNQPVLSKLELITLEITKAILINKGPGWYQDKELIERAENIAIALYSRFEENNSLDDNE